MGIDGGGKGTEDLRGYAFEECFQSAKNETGLDHYQVRRYDAWYRHATLAILAHALPPPIPEPAADTVLDIRRSDRLGGILHEYQHAS